MSHYHNMICTNCYSVRVPPRNAHRLRPVCERCEDSTELMQDSNSKLSKWLANRVDSRRIVTTNTRKPND